MSSHGSGKGVESFRSRPTLRKSKTIKQRVGTVLSDGGQDSTLKTPRSKELIKDRKTGLEKLIWCQEAEIRQNERPILHEGTVQKQMRGLDPPWQPRVCKLSDEWLTFLRKDGKSFNDVIPLDSITAVTLEEDVGIEYVDVLTNDPKSHVAREKIVTVHFVVGNADKVIEGQVMFKCGPESECKRWATAIKKEVARVHKIELKQKNSLFKRVRLVIRDSYNHWITQAVFGGLILANFLSNVIESQMMPLRPSVPNAMGVQAVWEGPPPPLPDDQQKIFDIAEDVFTYIFLCELVWNMAGNLWWNFWLNGWNVFDFIVVTLGVIAEIFPDVPVMNDIRLLRVFRAVRLFRKLKSLRLIFNALIASLVPVINSVLILVIVTAMYSVIAVELYGGISDQFFDFKAAMFSMYQVATGDSWAMGVARPLFYNDRDQDGTVAFDDWVMAFFVSYTIISILLLNVVVAVLLDNFTKQVNLENDKEKENEVHTNMIDHHCRCLDPILEVLMIFDHAVHLEEMIRAVFDRADANKIGAVDFSDLQNGLASVRCEPPILLTEDDFDFITVGWRDDFGRLNLENFSSMMWTQLEMFIKRKVGHVHDKSEPGSHSAVTLMALKMILAKEEESWNIMSDSEDEDSPDTGAGDTSGWPEYRVDPNNGAIGLGRDGEHPSPFHKPSATQQNSFSDRRSPDPVVAAFHRQHRQSNGLATADLGLHSEVQGHEERLASGRALQLPTKPDKDAYMNQLQEEWAANQPGAIAAPPRFRALVKKEERKGNDGILGLKLPTLWK